MNPAVVMGLRAPQPFLKRRLITRSLVVAGAVTLSACSLLQTIYEQAPRYVQWRTNVAHHFTDDQYERAQTAIGRWFDWQRSEQMPRVSELLRQAAIDARGPVSPALACERRQAYLEVAKAGIASATPLAASVIVHLGPEQARRVQAFFDDLNDDYREKYLADDADEQARRAVAFIEQWGSLVYGDFTPAQRASLAREVQALPFNARTLLVEFQRFQGRYVQLLHDTQAQKLSAAQVSQRLQAMLLDGIDPQEPVRKAQMQRWVQAGCALASSLQAQTTPAQRERASRTLMGWQDDVIEIASSR